MIEGLYLKKNHVHVLHMDVTEFPSDNWRFDYYQLHFSRDIYCIYMSLKSLILGIITGDFDEHLQCSL